MIKFRAWFEESVLKKAHMVDWEELKEFKGLSRLFDDAPHSETFSLMQSTGFKDNNDTEVFEGDVINIHWFYADFDPVELGAFENEEYAERVIVKKEFGNFGFWWEEADSWVDLATLAMSARLDEESFEILGNIHANPELLSSGIE